MNEKPESEEFDDEEADEILEGADDVDVDRVIRDLDQARRRGSKSHGDPAWRRLERMLEDKRTAELTSDFDDYDIGLEDGERPRRKAGGG
jgi:hypothetical protein